jgi:hypothetical protein
MKKGKTNVVNKNCSDEKERLEKKLSAIMEIKEIFENKKYYEINDSEYSRIKKISGIHC